MELQRTDGSTDRFNRIATAPTPDEVHALGVRTDLVTACRIVYGAGKNRAWQMYHAGQLDFPTLRNGRGVVVPVAPLLRLLGLDGQVAADKWPRCGTPAGALAGRESKSRYRPRPSDIDGARC